LEEYIDIKDRKLDSCWKTNKKGLLCIDNEEDWNFRLSILKEEIVYWIDNRIEKTIEIIQLFYDIGNRKIEIKQSKYDLAHLPYKYQPPRGGKWG
jgi:hypothetical protein